MILIDKRESEMLEMTDPFALLRDKKILAVLDGDTELGEEIKSSNIKGNIKNALPYLSGPQLCELSNRFGLAVSYGWGSGTQSRWSYLDDLLAYCIKMVVLLIYWSICFQRNNLPIS